MHFQISSPHCVQVGMDRAINNLTIPLGQLREEIMVCTPPSCIETPVCDFCLDRYKALQDFTGEAEDEASLCDCCLQGADCCVRVMIILIPTEY